MAILVDNNGTIDNEGRPIKKTVQFLSTITEDIYIISGSHLSRKPEYEALLSRLGIEYVDIILNPLDQDTDKTFKIEMAKTIPNITLAIDNNPKIVNAYIAMGINAIYPKDL
jgi:CO dehydrogenase nickel-insertion accessory protein CooC1